MRKRLLALTAALCLLLPAVLALSGCAASDTPVLRVYNWEDYISQPTVNNDGSVEDDYVDLIAQFEEEYGVRVEYSTFGTNENMYNELKINAGGYDLVCPSDYMIMKMIEDDRYCVDIAMQLMASSSLLKKSTQEVLEAHIRSCVRESLEAEDPSPKIEEAIDVIEKMLNMS